jgi:RTA1 like protein
VKIALAGLSFQVITLVAFIVLAVDYAVRSRIVWKSVTLERRFKNFCFWLALATVLILVRCAYRVYELNEGYTRDSEALRDQGLLIGLEGV